MGTFWLNIAFTQYKIRALNFVAKKKYKLLKIICIGNLLLNFMLKIQNLWTPYLEHVWLKFKVYLKFKSTCPWNNVGWTSCGLLPAPGIHCRKGTTSSFRKGFRLFHPWIVHPHFFKVPFKSFHTFPIFSLFSIWRRVTSVFLEYTQFWKN